MPAFDFEFRGKLSLDEMAKYGALELSIYESALVFFNTTNDEDESIVLKNIKATCKDFNKAVKPAIKLRLQTSKTIVANSKMFEVPTVFPDCIKPLKQEGGLSTIDNGFNFDISQIYSDGTCSINLNLRLHNSGRITITLTRTPLTTARLIEIFKFTPRNMRSGHVEMKVFRSLDIGDYVEIGSGAVSYRGGSPFQIVALWRNLPWDEYGRLH